MDTPNQNLKVLLEQVQPSTLLVIAPSPVPAVQAYAQDHSECRVSRGSRFDIESMIDAPMHDLAVIAETLEHLDHDQGIELIGMIRNRYASRIYLVVNETADNPSRWRDADFFSLGMRRAGTFSRDRQTVRTYTYDLESYNRTRDWNNPKNWANPENFGKYWW